MAGKSVVRTDIVFCEFCRKLKTNGGPMKALTVVAHKIARVVYVMLWDGAQYDRESGAAREKRHRQAKESLYARFAEKMGYRLVPVGETAAKGAELVARGVLPGSQTFRGLSRFHLSTPPTAASVLFYTVNCAIPRHGASTSPCRGWVMFHACPGEPVGAPCLPSFGPVSSPVNGLLYTVIIVC
ncbi:MAG: hypothetical protein LBQ79_07880 [Deltaproteobacteria bacterium]|jgi:hypothetical protein|nr:hypothetical protein [Deltaproteobacteria bacterium]